MNRRFKVNFVPFGNFGDMTVPYMLAKLGVPFVFSHHTVEKKTIMTGSILGVGSRPNTIVWGTGIMNEGTKPLNDCYYKAVRGPRTLEKLKQHGIDTSNVALGDPALLLPKIYQPQQKIEKKYKLGIIPHIVDFKFVSDHVNANKNNFQNTTLINPGIGTKQIEKFINQILECEKIVSTCLHGIICAHAYNVPACWMRVGNRLMGDDVKFHDYFESAGFSNIQPAPLIESENISVNENKITLDTEPLWKCRPWIEASEEYFVDIDDPNWTTSCYPEGYKDRIWTDLNFPLV
jgi:pyruvyltransferase